MPFTRSSSQTPQYKDHVFVRLSYGEHCNWQFLLKKDELRYLESMSDALTFWPTENCPVEATWQNLVDEVVRDPEQIRRCVEAYPEQTPEFISDALVEMADNYPFLDVYFENQLAKVLYELGDCTKPDTKIITRRCVFRDSLLEERAAETIRNYNLVGVERMDWRDGFAEFIDDRFKEASSDDTDEDEEEEEEEN